VVVVLGHNPGINMHQSIALGDGDRQAPMAVELGDRLANLVAVRRFPGKSGADSRSLRFDSDVRMQHFIRRSIYVSFRRFLGDVRPKFMQHLSIALHDTLGSHLRDALQEGNADVVACLLVPWT
jgi:hypothetical protein